MSGTIGWHHPTDESDQWDGFNDSGIEHFRGSPIHHLAREINQNAIDAASESSSVVEVKFRLHEIETATIPDVKELSDNLECCFKDAEKESTKAKIFFENALKEFNKKKVSVLEISDYNTRGMRGPSENGTPFYAFVKAKGQSKKESETAAGSYGIGKFAPYAVSSVRTIFVSTVYKDDNGAYVQLTQGKSILMSHENGGNRKTGIGFWGVKTKCQPVVGVSAELPAWLQRVTDKEDLPKSIGTKISILCFDASKNWEETLAVSVAENFFGAISAGKLIVRIGEKYVLSRESIADFFKDDALKKHINDMKNEPEQLENCSNYLDALTNKTEVIVEESERPYLGLCQVRILLGEGLPKKVCALRNGMFISDYLNRLKSFPDFKEFVAVFECKNKKGNELLRNMEPPRHDDFEPERLPTQHEQNIGVRALAGLATWIRDMLKRHAKDPVSEVTELDELKDFFGDEGSEGSGKGGEEINPYGKIIIRAKPIKAKSDASKTNGDSEGRGEEEEGEGGGGGTGEGGGDGKGGKGAGAEGTGGGHQKPTVELGNVRAIPISKKRRKIAFTPTKTGEVSIRLFESGADVDYNVAAINSDNGIVQNGCVKLNVKAGSRVSFEVELNEDFTGAIKVVANEI